MLTTIASKEVLVKIAMIKATLVKKIKMLIIGACYI
jgi:hypothetical protein